MKVTRTSALTGNTHTLDLDVTEDQFAQFHGGGALVQDAFPHLSAADREFILTGVTPEEWEAEFGSPDSQHDKLPVHPPLPRVIKVQTIPLHAATIVGGERVRLGEIVRVRGFHCPRCGETYVALPQDGEDFICAECSLVAVARACDEPDHFLLEVQGPDDDIPARACMRSGLCCKKGPCAFGTWDAQREQCVHLRVVETLPNGAEVHACAIYDQIVGQPFADVNPAFGAGCCMPLFNTARDRIIAGRALLRRDDG